MVQTAATNGDRLGLCQWFHFQCHEDVDRTIELMHELGCVHLRTGISWADYHRPEGPAWYDWQMRRLDEAGLRVLLSIWHTPPSLSEDGTCAGPPRRLQDFADFIDEVIGRWGDRFEALELWNEPNNRLKWAFDRCDPRWQKFGRMIAMAGYWAQQLGKPTVLGGMIPVDRSWLALIDEAGALGGCDAVAIHGFPGMWWDDHPNWDWYDHWLGWEEKVSKIRPTAGDRPIWITETGLATWDLRAARPARFEAQSARLEQAVAAPVPRVYWYSLIDLDPAREAIEGFHVDENEYHLGLVTHDGRRKPAFERFAQLLHEPAPEMGEPQDIESLRG